jgi:hypothetical protein
MEGPTSRRARRFRIYLCHHQCTVPTTMTTASNTPASTTSNTADTQSVPQDDFFSDAPLTVCPMRKDGMGEGEICEACQ